jgi:transposase-like protein
MRRPSAEPERQPAALERTVESERPTRRRLSVDQQREIARLYAETSTPTSEIRKRFGIGESSLYRIVQGQGVPLRGRGGSSTPTEAPAPAAQPGAAAALPPVLARGGGRGAVRRATPSASRRTASAPAGGRGQFRIQFWGERVIQARDIRDALRQAESLGGLEVTSITRED